jgi:hypothetical protein
MTTKTRRSPKRRSARRAGRKTARRSTAAARVGRALPTAVERVTFVRRVLRALDRGERRARALQRESARDVSLAIARLEEEVSDRFGAERENAIKEAERLMALVKKTPAARKLRALPVRFERRVDAWLDRIGLVRKQRHVEQLAKIRRRHRTSPSVAATPAQG